MRILLPLLVSLFLCAVQPCSAQAFAPALVPSVRDEAVQTNQSKGAASAYLPRNRSSVRSGLVALAGISVNTLNGSGYGGAPADARYRPSVSPAIGMAFLAPAGSGRWLFFPQARFYFYDVEGPVAFGGYNMFARYESSLVMQGTFSVGYSLVQKERLHWFLAPGAGMLLLPNNTEWWYRIRNGNRSLYRAYHVPELVPQLSLTSGLSAGKHVFFWIHYNGPAAMNRDGTYKARLHSGQLGAGWRF